ncbi:MAG: hypothetical protein J0J04_07615 [Microbacterium sp.]|uniref:exonuclease domain-containing protein n=1 Tax=Microbacterium sp. TaxID=51671 RepID=UPI001AD5C035|nr:exonuclease domain-containing protein [Microbacterium sp.]MBN9214665.1 hypothetical protein [Microbacterium sp.]
MIIFDLETTSADAGEARIVTAFAGVLGDDGTVSDHVDLLARPDGFTIPAEATRIHGITTEKALADGIPLATALALIIELIQAHPDEPIAGQNIAYDFTVLHHELGRALGATIASTGMLDRHVLDSIIFDRFLYKYRKGSRQLENLARIYGVPLGDEAHGARADATAAGQIIQRQLRHPELAGWSFEQLHAAQVQWRAQQSASIEAWLQRTDPEAAIDPGWPLLLSAAVPA